MTISSMTARLPAGESACATLALAPVLVFVLFVLLDGGVSTLDYAKLAGAFLGIALLITAGAFTCFAFVELARGGQGSGWTASPRRLLVEALRGRWAQDRFCTLAWPLLLFLLLLPAFNAFKQRILPRAGFLYDPQLAAIDRALFGADPGEVLHRLIGSPGTTYFFDALYHSWFVPTTLGICLVGLCAGTRTRGQYMLAYAGIWIILGSVLAWLMPAAGPCFYQALVDPAGAVPFVAVQDSLAATGGSVRYLTSLGNQAYLLAHLDVPELVIGAGISAIPSVHNAMAVLFALAGFRIHRWLGLSASAFALLIWVGSVYLNWHYAIDGLVGAAGAIAIWVAAGWLVDRTMAAAARPDRAPTLGAAAA